MNKHYLFGKISLAKTNVRLQFHAHVFNIYRIANIIKEKTTLSTWHNQLCMEKLQ